jgi:DNA polymerase-1
LEKLKPSQTAKIKGYLLECGWEPTMWNYKTEKGKKVKTSPLIAHKVTKEPCPNLLKLGVHWVPKLIERLAVSAKRNLLLSENCKTGLIIKSKSDLKEDIVTMASDADTCGTPTSRFTHRGIVNIPRTSSYMGKEFRSLFKARKGMKMVGWDAEGLEARMEAHYVYPYDRDYAERIVTGNSEDGTDIHTLNWKTLGLKSRDAAKTFKYAITYGARSRKISEQMGVPIATAERWFTDFWAANVGLDLLMTDLEKEWASLDNKYLLGLDGRLITTRKAHALLNSKLQGGGAVVMKHAMIIADKLIRKEFGSEVAHGLIRYHDEEQWEVEEAYADRVGAIGARSVVQAGEYLKLNVPMDANYMVGDNWSETH